MKELKFNQGGQPIYLDDLNALQQQSANLRSIIDMFVRNMTGKSEKVGILHPSGWTDATHGTIIWQGRQMDIYIAILGEWDPHGDPLNVLQYTGGARLFISRNTTSRVMEDGTTKVCTEEYRGILYQAEDESDELPEPDNLHESIYLTNWQDYIIELG